jgi:hypothetical protein
MVEGVSEEEGKEVVVVNFAVIFFCMEVTKEKERRVGNAFLFSIFI